MNRFVLACLMSTALGAVFAVPALADPIVVESAASSGYNVAFAAVGWTQATGFTGVSISASLEQEGNVIFPPPNYNPIQVNSIGPLIAYITTAIGPNTTKADVVTSSTQTLPLNSSGFVNLFSGLTLPTGSYYLVIQSPIDTSVDYTTTAPYTLGKGITNVNDYYGTNGVNFEPADTFAGPVDANLPGPFLVNISGTPFTTSVPEPATLSLLGTALLALAAMDRRAWRWLSFRPISRSA